MISARKYRHKITIQSPTEAQDSYGGVTTTWTTKAIVWAYIRYVGSREYMQAKQLGGENNLFFSFRYDSRLSSINKKWRIQYDSRTFDIESIRNIQEMDKTFEVEAVEHNA